MSKKRNKVYDLEFKQSSAKLALESERPISETARALGINENTLHGWVKKYVHLHKKSASTGSESEKLQQEVSQLRKENTRLKMERDILKKAAAYFANETL